MGSGGAGRPARAVRTGAGRSAGAGCHLVSWGAEVTERTAAGALGLRPWPPGLWLLDCGRGPHYGQGPQTAAGVPDCGSALSFKKAAPSAAHRLFSQSHVRKLDLIIWFSVSLPISIVNVCVIFFSRSPERTI